MKEIKKSASFKSKQKGKDVKFNIDLNYSPEYDSFNIKVKEGEGFMSYSWNIERMPLEVIQKLNEMLEEVLIKAGSKEEMLEDLEVELGAEPNPSHSFRRHEGSVKLKTHRVKVKSLNEARNKVMSFIEENDLGAGNFTGGDLFSHGKKIGSVSYNGRLWNLKNEPIKMFDGGDFQAGVYKAGGSIKESDIKVGEKFKLVNGEVIEIKKLFTENIDENWVGFTRNGVYQENSVRQLKIFINNWREGKSKYDEGGEVTYFINKDGIKVRSKAEPEKKLSEAEWMAKHNASKEARTYGLGGLFHKAPLMSRPKYIQLDDKQVMLKSGEYVQVLDQAGDNLMVLEVGKLGTGAKPKMVKISDVDMTSFANGGGVGLIGNQKRIDMNHNGRIDAEDFKLLRSSMNGAWRNERKHVNHSEDYEVRYARKKPSRTGYKGKRNFATGGGISNFERLSRVVAKNYEGKRVKPKYQKEYGKVYSKSEAKEVGNKVAGKVKAMQKAESGASVKKTNRGGVMLLAKQIRKEGESWKDALKRAGQQLK